MTEKKSARVLERTYELIEDPAHWIQGSAYCDKHGRPCNRKDATSYCLSGAVQQACVEIYGAMPPLGSIEAITWCELERAALTELRKQTSSLVTAWNDDHTHEQVLDAVKRAIDAQ